MSEQDKYKEQKFWDETAKLRVYAAFDKEEYANIFEKTIGALEGKKILDVGCASGVSTLLMAVQGAEAYGMDISPELIKQAKSLSADTGVPAHFSVGDAENLEFSDSSMDVCFFGGVLHHLPDKQKALQECRRVLRDGGMLLAIEPNKGDFFQALNWRVVRSRHMLSPNEDAIFPADMERNLKANGYADIKIFTFREHLSFLGFLFPSLRKYFAEHGPTTRLEKVLLWPFDLFRKSINRGNFFVVSAINKN